MRSSLHILLRVAAASRDYDRARPQLRPDRLLFSWLWHTVCLISAGSRNPRLVTLARPRAPGDRRAKRRNEISRGVAVMPTKLTRRQAIVLPAGIAVGSLIGRSALAAEPVKIGLVAALSGASAKSGEGITRGLQIAIDEINAKG